MKKEGVNIAFLCRKHHNDAHRALDGRIGGGPRPRITALLRERAVRRAGEAARLMRTEGLTYLQVAGRMDVNPWTVQRWFGKYPEVAP